MRKFLRLTIPAIVAALLVASFASAGPGLGIAIDTNSLKGTGSNGNPFGLRTNCASGEILKWNGTIWACGSDNGGLATGDIDAITTPSTSGLSGGCVSGTCILTLLTSCTTNQILKWNGTSWACASDSDSGDITGVTAGTGLTGGGTSGTVTLTANLAGASCSAGNYMSALSATGTGTCTAEVGDISSVGATANMGLTGGATSGPATLGLLSTCANGQVLKSGSSGTTWTCANDDTTAVSGTTNYVSKFTSSSAVGISSFTDDGTTVAIPISVTARRLNANMMIIPSALPNGNTNDWDPSGNLVQANISDTGTFQSTSYVGVVTNTAGSTLTGLAKPSTSTVNGKIVFLVNLGDGSQTPSSTLTLKHQSGSSSADNQFFFAQLTDIVLPVGGMVALIYYNGHPHWFAFGETTNGRYETVTATTLTATTGTVTTLTSTDQADTPAIAPTALASGTTNDWNPTGLSSTKNIRVTTNAAGSTLGGLVAQSSGKIRCLTNYGTGALTLAHQAGTSSSANRFWMPKSANFVVPSLGSVCLVYDSTSLAGWTVYGAPGLNGTSNYIPKMLGGGVTDSSISDNGTNVTITEDVVMSTGRTFSTNSFDDTDSILYLNYYQALGVNIGHGGGTTTLDGAATAVTNSLTVGTTLGVAGATTLGDAAADDTKITGNVYSVGQAPGLGKPTPSSCGTSPSTIAGGSSGFRIQVGTGTATSCVITFANAFLDTPECNFNVQSGSSPAWMPYISAISASAVTVSANATGNMAGTILHGSCRGTCTNPAGC